MCHVGLATSPIRLLKATPRTFCLCVCACVCVRAAQFSVLQMHLRSLLRAEVEAVKFLNDEPHQLEGLHSRCHAINEAIGLLRRFAL